MSPVSSRLSGRENSSSDRPTESATTTNRYATGALQRRRELQIARLRHLPSSANHASSSSSSSHPTTHLNTAYVQATSTSVDTESGGRGSERERGREMPEGLRYALTGLLGSGGRRGRPRTSCGGVPVTALSNPYDMSQSRVQMRGGEGSAFAHCPICTEPLLVGQTIRTIMGCGHSFHDKCATRMLKFEAETRRGMGRARIGDPAACPVCRAPFSLERESIFLQELGDALTLF